MEQIKFSQKLTFKYEKNKSRFITYVKKIKNKEELEEFKLECINKGAHHNCFAYRYQVHSSETQGYDNNGEPNGTSGDALLKLIENKKLTNICIYVVRYFGGTKLGVGPLTRAYVNGAKSLLNEIELEEKFEFLRKIKVDIKNQKYVTVFLRKQSDIRFNINYDDNFVIYDIESHKDIDLDEISHLIF